METVLIMTAIALTALALAVIFYVLRSYRNTLSNLEKRVWAIENPPIFKIGQDVHFRAEMLGFGLLGVNRIKGKILYENVCESHWGDGFDRTYGYYDSEMAVIRTLIESKCKDREDITINTHKSKR